MITDRAGEDTWQRGLFPSYNTPRLIGKTRIEFFIFGIIDRGMRMVPL
jgi:hypothetical protein